MNRQQYERAMKWIEVGAWAAAIAASAIMLWILGSIYFNAVVPILERAVTASTRPAGDGDARR